MTVIRRMIDTQTRQMVDVTNSGSAGGTVSDAHMLTIYVTIPDEWAHLTPYVVYDVPDDKYVPYHEVATVSDGEVVIRPSYEVLRRVTGNRLTYQLVFTDGDVTAGTAMDTVIMTDRDDLMICRSLIPHMELVSLKKLHRMLEERAPEGP